MARDQGQSAVSDPEVMASVDEGSGGAHLVIADVTADEAWLSTTLADAALLAEWC